MQPKHKMRPDAGMTITTAAFSKKGGREENQDYCGDCTKDGMTCWVVADGLGGHYGGATASRLAVETVLSCFQQQPDMSPVALGRYVQAAQDAVLREQKREFRLYTMRTTIVVMVSDAKAARWAHVGDSRLYHFRDGRVIFQTRDHSVVQAMADAGEISYEAVRFHEDRNRLLRSLGNEGRLKIEVEQDPHGLMPGDAFLICSDGFWELITELEMAADLVKSPGPDIWLDKMETRILEHLKEEDDNYTAVAVFVDENCDTKENTQ